MTDGMDFPQLLTIKEAAHLLHVHPNTLRNWEREGRISALRVGPRRDRRYFKSSLHALLQLAN
jgi:excisionase family DNA binding protein